MSARSAVVPRAEAETDRLRAVLEAGQRSGKGLAGTLAIDGCFWRREQTRALR